MKVCFADGDLECFATDERAALKALNRTKPLFGPMSPKRLF